jgi:hypothetical protein
MLGILKLWRERPFIRPLGLSLHSYFLISDGDRDAVKILSKEEVVTDRVLDEALRHYEEMGVKFFSEGTCYYTSVDSKQSVELCRSLGSKYRDLDMYFVACRRDNCLYMFADLGVATVDVLILGEDESTTKIITHLPSFRTLLQTLFSGRVEVRERVEPQCTYYEVRVRENFRDVVEKITDFIKLVRTLDPRKLEEIMWEIKKEEVLPKLLQVKV